MASSSSAGAAGALVPDPLRCEYCEEWLAATSQEFESTSDSDLDGLCCSNAYCPLPRRHAASWRRILVGALLKVRLGHTYTLHGFVARPSQEFELVWPLIKRELRDGGRGLTRAGTRWSARGH